jgi:hypothetical protein
MRKAVVLFCVFVLFMVTPLVAQQSTPAVSEKIVVDVRDLPPELVVQLKARQQMENTGRYVRWGKEIGVAMDEGLGALTRHSAEFAETELGHFAMFLIAWKVMAEDVYEITSGIVGVLVGVPFLALGAGAVFWSYRRTIVPRRVLQEKDGKKRTYHVYNPLKDTSTDEYHYRMIWHGVAFVITVIISSLMIFG